MQINRALDVPESIIQRKGARKTGNIPSEVLLLLQTGRIETVNLTEWLAVDHFTLLEHVRMELGLHQVADKILFARDRLTGQPTMKAIPVIALEWLELFRQEADEKQRNDWFARLAAHRSDSVRCWAAYVVGMEEADLERKLARLRPFAADPHFGVREIAWMAVRESVCAQPEISVRLLSGWVREADPNLRRFAVEATRPRGVWARHITQLKEHPEWGLPLLEPLKADPSRYVQNSVANWLNDASKSQPDWVVRVCRAWLEESDAQATKRIAARAQRSLKSE